MKGIIESVSQLHKQLEKHPDVKAVFRQPSEREIDFYYSISSNSLELSFTKAMDAFAHNIEMLVQIEIAREEENKNTIDVIEAAQYLLMNIDGSLSSYTSDFKSEKERLLFINTAAMLIVFCVNCQVTRKISTLLDDDLEFKRGSGYDSIYRGHTNSAYKLIPSIYRNLSVDDGYGIINISMLDSLYQKSNLRAKYKKVFGSSEIDYSFCAFAQHSKAYSPFLDFTEDHKVALSFATGTTGPVNEYLKKDAALYSLSFRNSIEVRDSIDLSAIDIFFNEKRISPFSVIRGKELFLCKYEDFAVEAFILKDKTNDRMKYQKGCFLYFQRAVIINGNLLLPISFGRIKKYIIPASGRTLNKMTIYGKIRENYKHYLPDYLMNPYKYFEEAPL